MRMIMLITSVSIFIFCTHFPALNSLASCGQYFCKFICLLIKFCVVVVVVVVVVDNYRAQWEAQAVTHCPG